MKCLKKFPVYGMLSLDLVPEAESGNVTFAKLRKFGLDMDQYHGHAGGEDKNKMFRNNTIGDILNFLEEIDQQFDKDKLSSDDLQGLKEAL